MSKNTIRTTLEEWGKKQVPELSYHDVLNIALVPRRTVSRIAKGTRVLGPKHSLYLLTGLKMFKLTPAEFNEYQESKKSRPIMEDREKVVLRFIHQFRFEQRVPESDERLISKTFGEVDVNNLVQRISVRHLGGQGKETSLASLARQSGAQKNMLSLGDIESAGPVLADTLTVFDKVILANGTGLREFRKKHGLLLLKIQERLHILTSDDPDASLKKVLQMNDKLSHFSEQK